MRPFPAAMVLPGFLSRSGRDPLDSSHESGSAVGHGRANRGCCARTRAPTHSSQKQRSPGCVLTLRRPGFDTQLVLDRTIPKSPLPSGPAANLATIPDTRTGQVLAYDGASTPVPAHDCSDRRTSFPTSANVLLRSPLHLTDCTGRLQERTAPGTPELPVYEWTLFWDQPALFGQNRRAGVVLCAKSRPGGLPAAPQRSICRRESPS